MPEGKQRFDLYLSKLEVLLQSAGKQKNPALFLYRNNARTPLFMLEALAKMYGGIYHKKRFDKMKLQFKLLEDAIGAIDYYDNMAKNLSGLRNTPKEIIQYLQAQTREKIQYLNELLEEKKWITGNHRIGKIREKLSGVKWLNEEKEAIAIRQYYLNAIAEIISFTQSTSYHFDNMEEDVHELRRKLRWLSIYPQALQGTVQLSEVKENTKSISKYLTPEIIHSPFNKMPEAGSNHYFVLLNKNRFLVLSWMIDKLGKLKDQGLQLIAAREALIQTHGLKEAEALNKAQQLAGKKYPTLAALLTEAAQVSKTFFREEQLKKLIIGTAKTV